jgi:CCR4-NOT transcription complex subunit 10
MGFFGEGNHRKILLNTFSSKPLDIEAISFAKSCFLNGISCFHSKQLSFCPSYVSSEQEIIRLKVAILLSLSFCHLSLNDYSAGLSFARCALSLNPKGYQKCLANLYIGESLLLLDRVPEAMHHFNPNNATEEAQQPQQPQTNNSNEEVTPAQDFVSSWYPSTARMALQYNLSLAQTLRGDFDRATETLKQIATNSPPDSTTPIHVIMLGIYVQLQQGYIEGAKSLIRLHLPQFR